jgi:hypothetical protein
LEIAMKRPVKRLALTLVSLLFLACGKEPGAPDAALLPAFSATSDWTDQVVNLPGDVKYYASCVDDSLAEVGPILQSFHTVTTGNGTYLFIKVRILEGFHLVGDATGIWNPAVPNQQATYSERVSGVNGSYSLHFNTYLTPIVNEVSGTKIKWSLRITVTINANGQVTVDRAVEPCNIVGK